MKLIETVSLCFNAVSILPLTLPLTTLSDVAHGTGTGQAVKQSGRPFFLLPFPDSLFRPSSHPKKLFLPFTLFPCFFPVPLFPLFSFFLSAFSSTYYNSSCFFVYSVNDVLTH